MNAPLVLLVRLALSVTLTLAVTGPRLRAQTPSASDAGAVTRVPVTFTGGYGTDPRDHGRPVALIAAALGVPDSVFRDAFSRVHPADTGRGPTAAEAQSNKAALLSALAQHGVTNERLDAVSDYYRYDARRQKLWRNQPATANALVRGDAVVGYEVLRGGAGYTTPPVVTVPGHPEANAQAKLAFGPDFNRNGALAALLPAPASPAVK